MICFAYPRPDILLLDEIMFDDPRYPVDNFIIIGAPSKKKIWRIFLEIILYALLTQICFPCIVSVYSLLSEHFLSYCIVYPFICIPCPAGPVSDLQYQANALLLPDIEAIPALLVQNSFNILDIFLKIIMPISIFWEFLFTLTITRSPSDPMSMFAFLCVCLNNVMITFKAGQLGVRFQFGPNQKNVPPGLEGGRGGTPPKAVHCSGRKQDSRCSSMFSATPLFVQCTITSTFWRKVERYLVTAKGSLYRKFKKAFMQRHTPPLHHSITWKQNWAIVNL